MSLTLYNINDIYNKNVIVLGRKSSGKTDLLKDILDKITFDIRLYVNFNSNHEIDSELVIPSHSEKDFEQVYTTITENKGTKILIVENFNLFYSSYLQDNKMLRLLEKNVDYSLTTIFVMNNFQLNFRNISTVFYKYINLMFLSSIYFNVDNYVNNIFSTNITEEFFENLIEKYIDNKKYLVFKHDSIYYYCQ
ncbi:hypothetical protein Catovirus_1_868 [Catovirus CTV1]|uniref:Uncharacterized protein n=1 Tax=Catovirus CTV1 TaxID=1977631 RepID=A0A1V0SAY8_9VIRU|nr:hypothetical protein Catovirus_1_868 [Catovirus CTV1]